MWKVEVMAHKPYGFQYRIFRNEVIVGEGYRQTEHEAKLAGMDDMRLARSFNVGAPAFQPG